MDRSRSPNRASPTAPASHPPSAAPSEAPLVARSPEDLVALVPVALGFEPAHSLVLLTFGGEHPFHARIDLPAAEVAQGPARAEAVAALVEQLVEPARRHRVRAVVGVVYAADVALATEVEARLRARCSATGLRLLVALRVAQGRWFPLGTGTRRERREGVALDLADHPFRAEAVGRGLVTRGSRAELEATLAPDPAGAAGVRRELEAVEREEASSLAEQGAWVASTIRTLVAGRRPPSAAQTAGLLARCRDDRLREVAWLEMSRPDAAEHVELWSHVLRRTPEPSSLRVAPAVLLAFASWLAGNGALAWCALDRLAEVDAAEPLGGVIAGLLQDAVPPHRWDPRLAQRAGPGVP